MMQLSSNIMTHHSAMTSSLRSKFLKIDKFEDFSCDIDYNIRTDVFRDVISRVGFCPSKTGFGQGSGQNLVLTG